MKTTSPLCLRVCLSLSLSRQKRFSSGPLKTFSCFLRSTSHLSLVRSCTCCSSQVSRGRFLTCLQLCSWESNHNVADTCNWRLSGQMNECANRVLSLGIGVCLAETDDACSECGRAEAPSDGSADPASTLIPRARLYSVTPGDSLLERVWYTSVNF